MYSVESEWLVFGYSEQSVGSSGGDHKIRQQLLVPSHAFNEWQIIAVWFTNVNNKHFKSITFQNGKIEPLSPTESLCHLISDSKAE